MRLEGFQAALCLLIVGALKVSGAGGGTADANGGGGVGAGSRYSTRLVRTRYGPLRGIITLTTRARAPREVEAFLGVPYATPPVASLR
jgi:Carboxylesterase family